MSLCTCMLCYVMLLCYMLCYVMLCYVKVVHLGLNTLKRRQPVEMVEMKHCTNCIFDFDLSVQMFKCSNHLNVILLCRL